MGAKKTKLDSLEFSKILMNEGRRKWQDPDSIIEQIGITEGATLVDLGCGPGYFTVAFSRAVGREGTVYAVDRDPVMIQELRRNLSKLTPETSGNVRIIEADVLDTGIEEHCADVVFFAIILHDIEDKSRFFSEAFRIAKGQSSIFVDIDWQKSQMEVGPPLDRRLSESETRRILKENGLEIVHLINAGPYHYGFVAKRKSA